VNGDDYIHEWMLCSNNLKDERILRISSVDTNGNLCHFQGRPSREGAGKMKHYWVNCSINK